MIFDAHSDLPTFVYDEKKSGGATRVLERNYYRFFGGDKITSRVMAIWTRPERRKDATAYGLEVLNTLLKDIDESDSFELVRNVEEMQKTIREGRVACGSASKVENPSARALSSSRSSTVSASEF